VSQSSKRPGAKDISELKARLGLKKSGPAPAAKSGGGVVGPPGSRLAGGVIPAPPGAGPPPRPAIPDAKEDPFAAMNAMAAHGAVAAQPQIVVVHDGSPVERVKKRSHAVKFVLLGGLVVAPLVVGAVAGKLSAGAKAYNRTIDDAAAVREDTSKVREGLIAIQQVLQTGRERSRGAQGFVVGDTKLTDELVALPPLAPNIELVFESHLNELDFNLVAAVLSFYVEALELNKLIKEHVTATREADKVLKEGTENMSGFNPRAYAGLVEVPTAEEAQAGNRLSVKLVQLGSPVCEGQTKPSDQGCGDAKVTGYRYRVDELGPWGVKKLATAANGSVDPEGLIPLDARSKVLQQLAKGGKATVAEVSYTTRITKISETVDKLLESQKAIEGHLNQHAIKGKQFTFFM
jgi:hypothetical protein